MSTRVEVRELVKQFPMGAGKGAVHAVNGTSFRIRAGETLALVGESGSGKSTVGRCLLRLLEATSGSVLFDGLDIGRFSGSRMRSWRANAQMVFQDPFDALSPRMRVQTILEEPLRLHTKLNAVGRKERVLELLEHVRLGPGYLDRVPHELSGGEAQRIAIARAIATNPSFLVLDEPTSSLDLSVRASVLAIIKSLQERLGLTYLLISHDLHTVSAYADRVAVMYLGSIVEIGPAHRVFDDPQHPYTQALLSATLSADPTVPLNRLLLVGEIPSAIDLPEGCLFATRCPIVKKDCLAARPAHRYASDDHAAACIRLDDGTNKVSRTAAATAQATPPN
ncbi:ABC transporter ATP-binding protein [Candidatus Nephthysia bennettiae]